MKVHYPGPAVTGDAREIPVYYGALGVGVKPGENEIDDEAATTLLKLGHVMSPAPPEVAPETVAYNPEARTVETARSRRRYRTANEQFRAAGVAGTEE